MQVFKMDTIHVAVILVLVSAAWTCSPEGYREVFMDEMAHDSNIIAYGLVTEKFPHEYFSKSFSVEFEVKCSYKGGALPSKINISNAGYMPGMCGYKNFTVGMEYIVFLIRYGSRYEQVYDKTMEASSSMSELLSFCGLQMDYPSDGTNTGQCQDVQRDSCKEYKSARVIHPPPPPINKEGLSPPLFPDEDGSGEFTSMVMEMETTTQSEMKMTSSESKTEMTSSASKTDMTSSASKTEMTSSAKEVKDSTTMSVLTTSLATLNEKKKSSEVVIAPIVTPEARDEPQKPGPEYRAVNDGTGNSSNRIAATVLQLATALVLFWTLN